MHRRVLVGLVIAAVLLGGVGIAVLDGPAEPPETQPPDQRLELAQVEDANETLFQIRVFENGDARWTVEYRQRITNDTEIEQFNQFAEQFNTEETETFTNFQARASRLTADGTEITGRDMNATGFEREARYSEISRDGIVQMSFRWSGFAEQRNGAVVVSDVFDGGFVILEDQRLRIKGGENVEFDSVSPTPDAVASDDTAEPGDWVEWNGYREFGAGEIDVQLSPPDVSTGDNSDTASTNGADDSGSPDGSGASSMVPILVVLALLLGAGGTVVYYTRVRSGDESEPASTKSPPSPDAGAGGAEVEAEQLLSDEDRVLKLLEENGGRMRQVSIVEETEWSKSKVSMLLSDMEDNGDISKLRVGRENIVSLSGEEPEAAGSPFDDED
ncbi:helix-turn-helix transcriptional regulator [Halovenus halobia]|uniref:helix-turn-helix transcriptional regulator n=1 Tax=Halovenus halobia TaxID=3396622 RepID=UPI003F56CBED